MPTKTVSTQQSKQVLDATHYLAVNPDGPVVFYDIEGECDSTNGTPLYIQLVGTATPTSTSTIPLWSKLVVQANAATQKNGFSFTYAQGIDTSTITNPVGGMLATNGKNTLPVYVAISSTDNVYTAVAANTQVSVTFEETVLEIKNQVIVGDTTTGVDSLAVWTSTGPAKRLVYFKVSNSDATANAPVYLMLFAYASPATGASPINQWQISDTAQHAFGLGNGIIVQQGNPTTYAQNYNCYLYGSSTTQFFTATAATHWTMLAKYITP